MSFPIFIPSKGRAGRSTTCANLDAVGRDYTLITTPEEAEGYRACYKGEVLPLQREGMRIGQIRNAILEQGQEWVWMMDDDIEKLLGCIGKKKYAHSWEILAWIEEQIISYKMQEPRLALAGLTWRMDERKTRGGIWDSQVYHLLAFHLPTLKTIRYDEALFFHEDNDILLQILLQGLRTIKLTDVGYKTHFPGKTKGGGLTALYQARRHETEDAERLLQRYGPEIVSIDPPGKKNPFPYSLVCNYKRAAAIGRGVRV